MKKILFILLILVMTISLSQALPVSAADPPATIEIPVTIRDFNSSHPDFEYVISDDRGIVDTTLGGDKIPVYAGGLGTVTTHGQTEFDQWYRDTPGTNMRKDTTIIFTRVGNIYQYINSNFFPIDGELFGNEGRSHNYHFTLELHTSFTYQGGETFGFTGDDDLWLFINNKLVIDLGGVHGAESDSVSLDSIASSIGITPGNDYDFDLFFAERHTTQSNFKVETTIVLEEPERYCIEGNKINSDTGVGIAGWTISLLDVNEQAITSTTTNSTGGYEFCGLPPGDYWVEEETRAGWTNVSPTRIDVTIVAANITDIDFLNMPDSTPQDPPVEVGGTIYPADKGMMLIPVVTLVILLLSGTMLVFRRKRIHN
ncbi:MAG: fibro-slime domain-containing protein [Dehalococcoidales bacterium]|nr:fibro-slime domain-containing protein [Dehalococcoidales bacterium]